MATGTGLDLFEKKFPGSFYDVAICEQHAVTFAAGLATEGLKPVCAIYSTFLQRAYDQVVHDVCIQNLPVVFAMDRAGVVGNDGHTHQGVFDISYLRCLPNIVISAARDENQLQHLLYTATEFDGPFALRYPRGSVVGVKQDTSLSKIEIGSSETIREGKNAVILALGPSVYDAIEAAKKLELEDSISVAVIDARFVKPLDAKMIADVVQRYPYIFTVEDHALQGGFGSALLEHIHDNQLKVQNPVIRLGVQDAFVDHASQAQQRAAHGYDATGIESKIRETLLGKRAEGLKVA